MKFKEFMDLGIKTDDGVLVTKYLVDIAASTPDAVKSIKGIFEQHGYSLEVVPGEFFKMFTMNEKEMAELSNVLTEIEALGLKEVCKVNMRPATFKRDFVERVKFCQLNRFPYLHEDNTFIKELYSTSLFAEYTDHKKVEDFQTVQQIDALNIPREEASLQDRINMLENEDRKKYNQVCDCLNKYIMRQDIISNLDKHPLLLQMKDKIEQDLPDALLDGRGSGLEIQDVVADVMFNNFPIDAVDYNEFETVRGEILGALDAYLEELKQNEGRGLAA